MIGQALAEAVASTTYVLELELGLTGDCGGKGAGLGWKKKRGAISMPLAPAPASMRRGAAAASQLAASRAGWLTGHTSERVCV